MSKNKNCNLNCNIKKYIVWSLIGFGLSYGVIILNALGFFPLGKIIFAIVSILVLVGTFWKTKEFFWLFVVTLPLENIIISGSYLPFSLRAFQLIGGCLILALIIKLIFKKKWREKLNFKKWDILVLLLPILSLVGLINSPDKTIVIKQIIILFSFVLLFYASKYFLQRKKDLFEAGWFFIVGSEAVLLFGVYQAIAKQVDWKNFEVMDGRVNSTFTEPDWLAMYCVFLLAIILFLKLALPRIRKNIMVGNWSFPSVINLLLNIYFFLTFLVLFLTVARSGWVAFVLVLLVYFVMIIWNNYSNKFYRVQTQNSKLKTQSCSLKLKTITKEVISLLSIMVLAVIVAEVFSLSSFHFFNRATSSVSGMQKITISCLRGSNPPSEINNINELGEYNCRHINLEEIEIEKIKGNEIKEVFRPDPNVDIRKNIYVSSWQQIKKHPVLGYGLGSSSLFLGRDERGAGLNSSNLFLESWISFGIFGLVILIILIFFPIIFVIKNVAQKENEGKALFVILTAVAILIPNLFNAGILLAFFWVWLAVVNRN